MRTKTLLLACAALALSYATSQAQVYSANVVGYCTVVMTGNNHFTMLGNPFDNGAGNIGTNMVDPSGLLPTKSKILTWNGSGFDTAQKTGTGWNANPVLAPGTGFFVYLPSTQTTDVTNTFVGTVIVNSGGSITNSIPTGFTMWGSPIPYSGDLTTDTNLNMGQLLVATKSQFLTWNGSGYNTAQKTGTGWNATAPITVGAGFFANSKNAYTTNWIENASY